MKVERITPPAETLTVLTLSAAEVAILRRIVFYTVTIPNAVKQQNGDETGMGEFLNKLSSAL